MSDVMCHCGQPLHYLNRQAKEYVESLVELKGPDVPVTWKGRTWLVQRHYIALHGLRAEDLPALNFPEVTREDNGQTM